MLYTTEGCTVRYTAAADYYTTGTDCYAVGTECYSAASDIMHVILQRTVVVCYIAAAD